MLETAIIGGLIALLFIVPTIIVGYMYRKAPRTVHYSINPYDSERNYRAKVIDVINGARKHITLVRGEIPYSVYDEEVSRAMQRANDRGVEITLVCGPMVVVTDSLEHPVLSLADRGVVDLYYSNKTRSPHFVEADGTTLYYEEPHPLGALHRGVWHVENSYFNARMYRRRVMSAIDAGDVKRVELFDHPFVLLTLAQFEALRSKAIAKQLDVNRLSGEEIRDLMDSE